MDIDLLSKMVRQLILDNDKVFLPGIGAFYAEIVPSSFSDKGYTVNPPYRRLFFRSKAEPDTLLADLYASSNGVTADVAGRIIGDFTEEMKGVLMTKKAVAFPGLGRLRATKENNFFFVPDEDLDIYPEGFGLEPVSLKTHQETEAEVAAVLSGLRNELDAGNASDAAAIEAAADDTAEAHAEDVQSDGEVAASAENAAVETAAADDTAAETASGNEPDAAESVPSGNESCAAEEPMSGNGTDETEEPLSDNETDSAVETVSANEKTTAAENAVAEEADSAEAVDPSAVTGPTDGTSPETGAVPVAGDSAAPVSGGGNAHAGWRKAGIAIAAVLAAAALLLIIYLVLAYVCPDFINSILYDQEELEVLRYGQR